MFESCWKEEDVTAWDLSNSSNKGIISASQEEKILTAIRTIFASQEGIEEHKTHEQEANLKVLPGSPCRFGEENKKAWETFNGEHIWEHEIEDSFHSWCQDPLCKIQMFKDLLDMTEEDLQVSEEENQGIIDYIEEWFQTFIQAGPISSFNITWHQIMRISWPLISKQSSRYIFHMWIWVCL